MSDDIRGKLQSTLGNAYTLEQELGGGGMSRVFVAEETALRRKVVVKVLSPELTAGVNVERFNREILLAAKLQHPHIVPVLAAGETNGLPYYTMPFVEGESLRVRLARTNGLSITDAIGVMRDVAKALAYAHERGIVHRDIKPDNVLITGGSATVTDFGIAKAISAARTLAPGGTLTQVGTSIGTPTYMAPEQAAADPDTDHRADLYSFGCLAYELLTARPPFVDKTPRKLLAAHMGEKPEPVNALRLDAPTELADLIMRCLEKDPDQRPQNASDVVRVLESVTSGGTQPAMPGVLLGGKGMFRRALMIYAAAFVAVAILTKAAIVGVGLPDWVFPGVLVVMALGLPVILWTAYVHRVTRRAFTVTPTYTPGGTPSMPQGTMATLAIKASPHMSWRRTARGGVLALSAFVVIVGVYMAMRAFGIGPVGSLLAAGKLKAKEPILLTDFTVTNGDSALGRVVSDALRAGLTQSSVISLVSTPSIAAALQRMQRSPTDRVDLALGRQLAAREGIKLIVDGQLTPLGSGYVVVVQLATADSAARELASYRATADGLNGLIGAVDKIARQLRGRIGESMRSVQSAPALARVTTSSLAALRQYSEGNRANIVERDYAKAVQLLREAVALDSTFATAWRRLGQAMSNLGLPRAQQDSALSRAYQYRDRLPLSERDATVGAYFALGPGRDRAKAIAAYEAMLARGDSTALNNLGLRYASRREWARAESLFRASVRIEPALTVYNNLLSTLRSQGKLAAADSLIAEAHARFPASTVPRQQALTQHYSRGELDAFGRLLDSARKVPDPTSPSANARNAASLALLRGRVGDWRRLHDEARNIDSARGVVVPAVIEATLDAHVIAVVLGKAQDAVARLDAAVARSPFRALPDAERPYLEVARAYAMAEAAPRAQAILAQYRAEMRDTAIVRDDEPALHRALGQIAVAEKRYDVARNELRKSDLRPDGPVACVLCLAADLARAFDAAGMRDSAIAEYERYVDTPSHLRLAEPLDPLLLPRTFERLGQLYEAKGDPAKAKAFYARFVELWKNADPELQPRVAAARQRIATLR